MLFDLLLYPVKASFVYKALCTSSVSCVGSYFHIVSYIDPEALAYAGLGIREITVKLYGGIRRIINCAHLNCVNLNVGTARKEQQWQSLIAP